MSLFRIKIVGNKAKEEKEWKISYVRAGQKAKTCCICSDSIPIGSPATTFMKMLKYTDESKKFMTHHTCGGKSSSCTIKKAEELKLSLP